MKKGNGYLLSILLFKTLTWMPFFCKHSTLYKLKEKNTWKKWRPKKWTNTEETYFQLEKSLNVNTIKSFYKVCFFGKLPFTIN